MAAYEALLVDSANVHIGLGEQERQDHAFFAATERAARVRSRCILGTALGLATLVWFTIYGCPSFMRCFGLLLGSPGLELGGHRVPLDVPWSEFDGAQYGDDLPGPVQFNVPCDSVAAHPSPNYGVANVTVLESDGSGRPRAAFYGQHCGSNITDDQWHMMDGYPLHSGVRWEPVTRSCGNPFCWCRHPTLLRGCILTVVQPHFIMVPWPAHGECFHRRDYAPTHMAELKKQAEGGSEITLLRSYAEGRACCDHARIGVRMDTVDEPPATTIPCDRSGAAVVDGGTPA
ncbi:unnamed protein product, partial [Prorocentrum cordatum]